MFDQQCALGTSLCLEEPIWLWIYLSNFKSHQNWLLRLQEPSIKERDPENSKWQSYWNHSNVSLIPSMTKEKRATITALVHNQNWKLGDTKINFASLIPLQMTKFHTFWIPEYFPYQCTLLIKIQSKGNTIIFTSKFSFAV